MASFLRGAIPVDTNLNAVQNESHSCPIDKERVVDPLSRYVSFAFSTQRNVLFDYLLFILRCQARFFIDISNEITTLSGRNKQNNQAESKSEAMKSVFICI